MGLPMGACPWGVTVTPHIEGDPERVGKRVSELALHLTRKTRLGDPRSTSAAKQPALGLVELIGGAVWINDATIRTWWRDRLERQWRKRIEHMTAQSNALTTGELTVAFGFGFAFHRRFAKKKPMIETGIIEIGHAIQLSGLAASPPPAPPSDGKITM